MTWFVKDNVIILLFRILNILIFVVSGICYCRNNVSRLTIYYFVLVTIEAHKCFCSKFDCSTFTDRP